MAKKDLTGKKVAILVDEGFEQVELIKTRKALDKAGAQTQVVSPQEGEVRGWNVKRWAKRVAVDVPLESADPAEFDALLLPGGVMNAERLRIQPTAVEFVKRFFDAGKPVAAICHGPGLLLEAGVVDGRTLTSWPSLRTDIRNAGGHWVDEQVQIEGNLVTSRKPDDLEAFSGAMIDQYSRVRASASTGR